MEVSRHPVLSKEAQLRHCYRIWNWQHHPEGKNNAPREIVKAGQRSMDVMVRTNLRLVISVAKKYQNRGLELLDLIQEGNLGLIRGLELFDPARGYSVTTYSYWWIRQAVTRSIYTYGRTIRMPINTYEILNKVHRFMSDHMAKHGVPMPKAELAAKLNITTQRLETVLAHFDITQCFSLDAPAIDDGKTESTIKDLIVGKENDETDEDDLSIKLTSILEKLKCTKLLDEALDTLDPRERLIIKSIFMEHRQVKDVAEQLRISRSRIRQIQNNALSKVRAHIEELPS
jgi:RNA polymerase sigma factor (sigma-70 family)